MNPGTKKIGSAITGLFLFLLCCGFLVYFAIQVKANMGSNAPGFAPAPAITGAPGTTQCAQSPAAVYPSPSPSSFTITAPAGSVIGPVYYSNFGNATGLCGAYTSGACDLYPDSSVLSLVQNFCTGKSTCTIPLTSQTFGALGQNLDPSCSNPTYMTVQYSTEAAGSPSPSPTPSPS